MDYNKSFINRASSYMYAMNNYPNALENEFTNAINILDPQPNEVIMNIPSGGVFLEKYLNNNIIYKSYETSLEFAQLTDISYCLYTQIPENNNSIDKIIVLANLHHSNNEERKQIYKEIHRIIKPNGKFIIGDVIKTSKQDDWLNIFVDSYNTNGHKGIFWNDPKINPVDKKLLEECGFSVETIITNYTWNFDSKDNMLDFCKNLFGLDKINDNNILFDGLNKYLIIKNIDNKYFIDWQLIYFISTKLNP
jgi:hypothetical protein